MKKLLPRRRRAKKIRWQIGEAKRVRLTIHRTPKHIYAQVFNEAGTCVLAAASSVEKVLKENTYFTKGKLGIAKAVGELIAERATFKGISQVAFDRSGFKYHGRVKALADGARSNGLEF